MVDHKGSCVGDEELEDYALGRMAESRTVAFEEHLLVCPHCQDRLAQLDIYIRAVRAAGSRLRAETVPKKTAGAGIRAWIEQALAWGRSLSPRSPALAMVPVMALLVMAAPWMYRQWIPSGSGEPTLVNLEAFRSSPADFAQAWSDRPVRIRIRTEGFPPGNRYALEIANATGETEWEHEVTTRGEWLEVTTPHPLPAGQHFVRLSTPEGSVLHEFSLRVGEAR